MAHSYAAAPVTGAAGRLGDRLKRLVYVDSGPFAEGMCMLDLMPAEAADRLRQQAAAHGARLPIPPFEVLGLTSSLYGLDETRRDVLYTHATPQPFGTYTQAGPGVDWILIACRDFTGLLDAGVPMLAFLNQPPWRRFDLPTGHWPILSASAELADILDAAVS